MGNVTNSLNDKVEALRERKNYLLQFHLYWDSANFIREWDNVQIYFYESMVDLQTELFRSRVYVLSLRDGDDPALGFISSLDESVARFTTLAEECLERLTRVVDAAEAARAAAEAARLPPNYRLFPDFEDPPNYQL
mmetsp:Transcript_28747/g.35319  ORF Transcript_28747/g.35319 Transcript_28747/m.35319 type:complete len:136 (+) Transcript_28747:683-1090(+)